MLITHKMEGYKAETASTIVLAVLYPFGTLKCIQVYLVRALERSRN